jgi:hypothetical protein
MLNTEHLITVAEERPLIWGKTLDTSKDGNLTRAECKQVCWELRTDFEDLNIKDKNEIDKF